MKSSRLEAYSDAVIAIVITIMVLELRTPEEATLASLKPLIPTFIAYIVSFLYLSIYWNTHHHMFQTVEKVNGAVLWANVHLLLWLSLIPFTSHWLSEQVGASIPSFLYAINLFMAGFAFFILKIQLKKIHSNDSMLVSTQLSNLKEKLSLFLYILAIAASILNFVAIAYIVFVIVPILWLIPDKGIEAQFQD